jgi:Mg2+/Co2+ transporter CorC
VDTLGGLVVALLGSLPQRGEIVRYPSGLELQVLEADPRRVKRLRLRQPQPPSKPANPA